jgi:hypothetical protein
MPRVKRTAQTAFEQGSDEDEYDGVPAACSTADELSEAEDEEEGRASTFHAPWAGSEAHEAYNKLVGRALRDQAVACVFPVQLHDEHGLVHELSLNDLARSSAVHASRAAQLHTEMVGARVRGQRAADDAFRTLRCTVPHRCRPGCLLAIRRASAESWRPARALETQRNDAVYALAMHALEHSRRQALDTAARRLEVDPAAIEAVIGGRDPIVEERDRFALRVSETTGTPVLVHGSVMRRMGDLLRRVVDFEARARDERGAASTGARPTPLLRVHPECGLTTAAARTLRLFAYAGVHAGVFQTVSSFDLHDASSLLVALEYLRQTDLVPSERDVGSERAAQPLAPLAYLREAVKHRLHRLTELVPADDADAA